MSVTCGRSVVFFRVFRLPPPEILSIKPVVRTSIITSRDSDQFMRQAQWRIEGMASRARSLGATWRGRHWEVSAPNVSIWERPKKDFLNNFLEVILQKPCNTHRHEYLEKKALFSVDTPLDRRDMIHSLKYQHTMITLLFGGGLFCLTPLSTIFQLYRGGHCYL